MTCFKTRDGKILGAEIIIGELHAEHRVVIRVKIQISFSCLRIFDHVEITGFMSAGIDQIFNHFTGTKKGVGLPDREGGQKDHSAIAQYYEYLTDIKIGR